MKEQNHSQLQGPSSKRQRSFQEADEARKLYREANKLHLIFASMYRK